MKEISLGKRAKISQAQQYMILAVFGASIFLGTAIAVVINSINKISFNANIIATEEQSIVSFSDTIKNIGICKKPSGSVYSNEELEKCNPNGTEASEVPGTLRANILENMASNPALNSTPNRNIDACINPKTEKNYTYDELEKNYEQAETDEELVAAGNLIKSCSALRIIPDALPATKNPEALLSSVNKIFLDSGTEPETLTPSDDNGEEGGIASFGTNLYKIGAMFRLEDTDIATLTKLLTNIERSIRNFDFVTVSLEWKGTDSVEFSSRANAYYMGQSILEILDKSLKPGGK